jgi:hypothetical protein
MKKIIILLFSFLLLALCSACSLDTPISQWTGGDILWGVVIFFIILSIIGFLGSFF